VELSYTVKQQIVTLDSSTGAIGTSMATFDPTPRPVLTTTYYLDAYDAHRVKLDSRNIPITVIDPPIKIESLTVSPLVPNFDDGPADITLSWIVTPAEMIKRLEIEGVADVTGLTSYVIRGATAPGPHLLRAIGIGGDEHIGTVRSLSLHEYLIGKKYQVTNDSEEIKTEREWLLLTGGAHDRLEIVSASEARYTVDNNWSYQYQISGPQAPTIHPPVSLTGTWSTSGMRLQVETAAGTLHFTFVANSPKGEALRSESSTEKYVNFTRNDQLLTPG
jgi:hypothetical protein